MNWKHVSEFALSESVRLHIQEAKTVERPVACGEPLQT